MHGADDRTPRVADDGVEAAETRDGLGDRRLDARSGADVELEVAAAQVARDDDGTLLAEPLRDRRADARRATRDERPPSFQPTAQ